METTWRARPVLTARLTFALLIAMLVLALAGGALLVGSQLTVRRPRRQPQAPRQ